MGKTGDRLAFMLWAVTTAIAFLVVVATFGTPVPISILSSVNIDKPLVASSDGDVMAVADTDGRRLLVLEKNDRLKTLYRYDLIGAPFEAVTDVCVCDGVVYVAGLRYAPDSSAIVQERVVSYKEGDATPQVVYELVHDDALVPSIKALAPASDSVVVIMCNEDDGLDDAPQDVTSKDLSYLHFIIASPEGNEEVSCESIQANSVFDVGFDADTGDFVTLDVFGVVNDESAQEMMAALDGHVFTSIDMGRDGYAYAYDDVTGGIYRVGNKDSLDLVQKGKGFERVHVTGDVLSAVNRDTNSVFRFDLQNGDRAELQKVSCATSLISYTVLIWICRLYLAGTVTVLGVRRLRRALAKGDTSGIGGLFAAFCVLCAITLAIASTSYGSYESSRNVRVQEIGVLADYLEAKVSALSEDMERCNDRKVFRAGGEERSSAIKSFTNLISEPMLLTYASARNDIGMYFSLYGLDDQGPFLLYDSMSEYVIASEPVSKLEENHIQEAFLMPFDAGEIYEGQTLRDTTRFRLVRIPSADGTKTIGVIEIGSKLRSFESAVASELAERVVALLVGLFVVYIAYSELRSCAGCILQHLKLRDENPWDALAILTRPFNFLVITLAGVDAVMSTLIGRSLLTQAGLPATGLLLALPATMQGIGLAIGHFAYAILGSRVPGRKLMTRGALLLIVGALFTAAIVWAGSFPSYCLAKLVIAVPLGLFTSMVYSLPRQATDKSIRADAAGGVKRTDTSGAATGTVLGGYVAQTLGQPWVYVLVVVVSVCVLAAVLALFSRNSKPLEAERQHSEEERESLWQFFLNHHTQALILCVMLPSILAAGYNSFLFPVYSAELGVSTSTISNLFVLGQLVVYVAIDSLDRLDEYFGRWRVDIVSVAGLGAVFLLFSFNRSQVWAVTVIALVGVLCKASDAWKALWIGRAMRHGLPAGRGVGTMFATRSVLQVIQPLLLGLLLSSDQQVAATVLGAICLVCSLAFYVLTRHSKFA